MYISGIFSHNFANVLWLFVMLDIYSPRFFGTLQSCIQMRSSNKRTGSENLRTVIFMVRVLFGYLFAQFRECLQLFATLDIYYSLPFRNFAVLHTNEEFFLSRHTFSEKSENNSRTFGIFSLQCSMFRWLFRISASMLKFENIIKKCHQHKKSLAKFSGFAGFPITKVRES